MQLPYRSLCCWYMCHIREAILWFVQDPGLDTGFWKFSRLSLLNIRAFGRGTREENLGKIKVNLSIQKGTSSNYLVWKTYLLSRIKSIIITTALIRKTTYIKRCVVSNNYLNTNLASLTPQGASSRIKNSFQRNLHV